MAKKDVSDRKEIVVNEPPPIPRQSIFGKKPSIFSGGSGIQNKGFSGTRFTPPQIRVTQNKGGGGK
jgi:hypothetical protein